MGARAIEYPGAAPSPRAAVDEPGEAAAVADRLLSAALGALDILAIALGDRLGYYRLLAHREALTPPPVERDRHMPVQPLEPPAKPIKSEERQAPAQFRAPAEDYDHFMGRYTPALATALADAAGIQPRMRVLDVGCGPGGLTRELATRLGAGNVAAIDPAAQFAAACRDRNPGADVRTGVAEELPWPAAHFDAALSCLVIGFMRDPGQGVQEMARVTRPGGIVAACMWDIASGGMTMLRIFWTAAQQVVPAAPGESAMTGTTAGDIARHLRQAGLQHVTSGALASHADYAGFDDFWQPFTLAVGPSGHYLRSLDASQQAAIRDACRAQLPDGPFTLPARAWYARGLVPPPRRS